jgi:parvulin-like peptidyl-prolyl isomerase
MIFLPPESRSDTVGFMPDKVRASHILLMYRGSARSTATRSQEEAQTQIAQIKSDLDAGADFADLASNHSDCPSRQGGGDLGEFGRGQMVGPFEQTAFGMQIGETSGVVETDFGYHIIRRTG